jgi:DNA-binding HxlR family transcriptional regulator
MVRLPKRFPRSGCPIATTLDLVGDRWSLVIIRDMLNGKTKYSEFLASPERITTNILADRLFLLEQIGLAEKSAYQKRPLRFGYRLTKKGEGLLPVLQEMSKWANKHMPETWVPPDEFMQRLID